MSEYEYKLFKIVDHVFEEFNTTTKKIHEFERNNTDHLFPEEVRELQTIYSTYDTLIQYILDVLEKPIYFNFKGDK